MSHHLYMEVEGIQRFLFAATKLIRGGSAVLDVLNRDDMPTAVRLCRRSRRASRRRSLPGAGRLSRCRRAGHCRS